MARDAHRTGTEVEGYIVYHPMIVVEVGEKEICISKNENGQCMELGTVCSIGAPKTLPDYSKPYLLNPKSGFGKAGVDVKIEDGWRLSSIKDESDNSSLLSVLAAAGGIETSNIPSSMAEDSGCSKAGFYRLSIEGKKMILDPILEYLR